MPKNTLIALALLVILSHTSFAACTYTPRDCYYECKDYQSYPTYAKEKCITKCVDEDSAARAAYYTCLSTPTTPTNPPATPPAATNPNSVDCGSPYITCKNNNTFSMKPDAARALEAAAVELEASTGKRLRITDANRTVREQAEDFYDNCLSSGRSIGDNLYQCRVLTCNPATGAGVVTGTNDDGYSLREDLEGADREEIVRELVDNNKGNCPHTRNTAVDAWCEDSGGYVADVSCQTELARIMFEKGFCRLNKEGWHFEWNATRAKCGNTAPGTYTRTLDGKARTIDPSMGGICSRWNYLLHYCVSAVIGSESAAISTQGDAGVVRGGRATSTSTVKPGDSIKTDTGTAKLTMDGGGTVELAPRTEVRVMQMDGTRSLFELIGGKIRVMASTLAGVAEWSFLTPAAMASMGGTEFIIEHDAKSNETLLYVNNGSVYIETGAEGDCGDEEPPSFGEGEAATIGGTGIEEFGYLTATGWSTLGEGFAAGNGSGGYVPGGYDTSGYGTDDGTSACPLALVLLISVPCLALLRPNQNP